MTAYQDIGPAAPARWRVYRLARELQARAGRAAELATAGIGCDVTKAQAEIDAIRAILGGVPMYKRVARSLRRATQVHAIALSPIPGALSEDDFIPTADNMGERECEAERAQLLLEKTRCETELAIAKRSGSKAQVEMLGHRLAGISSRLGLIKRRLHSLRQQDALQSFSDAVNEIVPKDIMVLVRARQAELLAERKKGGA